MNDDEGYWEGSHFDTDTNIEQFPFIWNKKKKPISKELFFKIIFQTFFSLTLSSSLLTLLIQTLFFFPPIFVPIEYSLFIHFVRTNKWVLKPRAQLHLTISSSTNFQYAKYQPNQWLQRQSNYQSLSGGEKDKLLSPTIKWS